LLKDGTLECELLVNMAESELVRVERKRIAKKSWRI